MSCPQITPLLLSDTFNTWFERTNLMISTMNTMNVHGITAMENSGFKIEATGGSGCTYNLSLELGPFLGFVTGGNIYDSGVYGTGDAENPYLLTMKFRGTERELDYTSVATGDYVLVSDTDDEGEFKKVQANAFLTRLQAGANIVIENNGDGSFTIGYNEVSYIVDNPVVNGNNGWNNNNQEIGTNWSGELTFSIDTNDSSDVLIASANVSLDSTDRTQFIPAFNSGGYNLNVDNNGYATVAVSGLSINFNSYTINNPSINFRFNTTSATVDTSGNPIQALNSPEKQATKSYYMSFRTFFLPGSVPSNAQAAVNDIVPNSTLTDHGLITQPNNRFALTNLTHGFSEDARFYFLHTVRPNGDGVGYTPELYPDNGNIAEDSNGFFALSGTAQYGGYTYKVWTTANSFGGSGINFGVENT